MDYVKTLNFSLGQRNGIPSINSLAVTLAKRKSLIKVSSCYFYVVRHAFCILVSSLVTLEN